MGIIRNILTSSLFILIVNIELHAQFTTNQFPEIGKPIPYFELKGIRDYSQKKASSEGLKGKPFILYFWSKYCKSAVKGVFKADSLNKEYSKNVNLFLIGGHKEDESKNYFYYEGMEPGRKNHYALYERLKEKGNLLLPMVFDSDLFYRFLPSTGVPQVIYVDKDGIVQAITYALDREKIEALIQGRKFISADTSAKGREIEAENKYSRSIPFLVNGNGGSSTNFMFRSILSNYTRDMQNIPAIVSKISLACNNNYLRTRGRLEGRTSLKDLYRLAYLGYTNGSQYYGKNYMYRQDFSQVILELENDSLFKKVDYEKRNNLFVYSLIVPSYKATPEYLMQVIQRDLTSYFGYRAKIEKRQLPYWSIKVDTCIAQGFKSENQEMTERGQLLSDGFTKLGCRNKTIDNYLASILSSIGSDMDIPIINESQVDWRIDIPLTDVFMLDFNEIKSVLKKQGFIIKKRIKEFNVLVLSD